MARKPSPKSGGITADTRVALIHSKEPMLTRERIDALTEALRAAHGEVDTVRFDGLSASPAEVFDECRMLSLMPVYKLVIVDDADTFAKEEHRPAIERYCDSPAENATLLLTAESWRLVNLTKKIAAVGAVVEIKEMGDHDAAAWCLIAAEERHGASIEKSAAMLLVERLGVDLSRLDGELEKLAIAAGKGGKITQALIHDLVGGSRAEIAWRVQNAILSGDPSEALGFVRSVMEGSPRDEIVPMMYSSVDLARKVNACAFAKKAGRDPTNLASPFKIWGDTRIFEIASKLPVTKTAAILRECVEADKRSKSGWDPYRTIEVLSMRLSRAYS